MLPEEWIDHFVKPLMELGFEPKADIAALAAALAEDAPLATADHAGEAVRTLRRKWTYRSFPTIKVCLDAVFEAMAEDPSTTRTWSPPPVVPSGNPPILKRARRRVAEWRGASDGERERMTRTRYMDGELYELSRRIMRLFGENPDEQEIWP